MKAAAVDAQLTARADRIGEVVREEALRQTFVRVEDFKQACLSSLTHEVSSWKLPANVAGFWTEAKRRAIERDIRHLAERCVEIVGSYVFRFSNAAGIDYYGMQQWSCPTFEPVPAPSTISGR